MILGGDGLLGATWRSETEVDWVGPVGHQTTGGGRQPRVHGLPAPSGGGAGLGDQGRLPRAHAVHGASPRPRAGQGPPTHPEGPHHGAAAAAPVRAGAARTDTSTLNSRDTIFHKQMISACLFAIIF